MTVAANIERVQERIADACARAGRSPDEITLVAVSKGQPVEVMLEALAAGAQHLGENRVEEAAVKIPQCNVTAEASLTWHMVGHIQSRKARQVVPLFDLVQSVDSLRLAGRLSRAAQAKDKVLPVLLEVNVSGEASKFGLAGYHWHEDAEVRQNLYAVAAEVLALPGLRVDGLMTMAPYGAAEAIIRQVFADLRGIRDALQEANALRLPTLSMGMTDDFPLAIEEGASMIRVGRAIFGERR